MNVAIRFLFIVREIYKICIFIVAFKKNSKIITIPTNGLKNVRFFTGNGVAFILSIIFKEDL